MAYGHFVDQTDPGAMFFHFLSLQVPCKDHWEVCYILLFKSTPPVRRMQPVCAFIPIEELGRATALDISEPVFLSESATWSPPLRSVTNQLKSRAWCGLAWQRKISWRMRPVCISLASAWHPSGSSNLMCSVLSFWGVYGYANEACCLCWNVEQVLQEAELRFCPWNSGAKMPESQ